MRRWIALMVAATMSVGAVALASPATAQSAWIPSVAAARELVGSIPEAQRHQCQIVDPAMEGPVVAGEVASIRAMVRCYGVNDLRNFWYILTDSGDSAGRVYRAFAGTFDPAAPYRDDEAECPGETTWGFGDAQDDGMLACYYTGADQSGAVHDETTVLVWTYAAGKIVALAETAVGDSDASELKQWWRDDAGPLSRPGRVKGFVDWTVRDRRAEQALLSHIPKATRGSCRLSDLSKDGALAGVRLWTSAVAVCKSGTINLAYGSMNRSVVENFVESFAPSDEGDPCPASGTWSEGRGKQRHTVGNYSCFIQTNADGSQTAWMMWSQRELGIAATANVATTNNDATAVYEWWEGDSGPV